MSIRDHIRDAQKQTIDRLAKCEASIGELYTAYGRTFTDMTAFWQSLAEEEEGHAARLKSLESLLDQDRLFFDLGRFDTHAMAALTARVQESLDSVRKGNLSESQAIQMALDVEASLMDAHFYDVVTSDAPEFAAIAERLSIDTKRHVGLIQQRLRRYLANHRDNPGNA